jgi:NADPH:quinone reductase-like Zn-dependent oxidoreductase
MRAFVLKDFGQEPLLTDLPEPEPGPKELNIAVRSSSVNGIDLSVVSGGIKAWAQYRLPITLGLDFSGVVEAVGDGATEYRPGDEVFGFALREAFGDGTWTERIVVPEDWYVARKPARLGFPDAGALPLAGIAALQAVEGTSPEVGETVLVVGASGGVGGFALQLAASRGAHMVATGEATDEERLRGLGAAETIDFTREDVAAAVRERHADGVDVLVDLATPADAFTPLAELVRDGGRIATSTGAGDADALARRGISLTSIWVTPEPAALARLADHADAGRVSVVLEQSFELEDAGAGLETFRRGTHGKVGIAVSG